MIQPMRMVMIAASLAVLFVAGCAGFLRPERGTMAAQEGRIALVENLAKGAWATGDVRVNYSLACRDGKCSFEGRLVFDDSVTNSFPVITKFFFYVSFLDGDGKVVATDDITPVIPTFGNTPASLSLRLERQQPAEAKFLIFHYYGSFRANPISEGGSWDISHFPFQR
jgi:hypothetical protein